MEKRNREFAVITYCFVGLFLCMMGYYAYFQAVKSEDFINSPYNLRQENFEQTVIRGSIFSTDGALLARTQTDKDGNEIRQYPYANRFSHIVGYSTKAHGRSGIESWMNFSLLRSSDFFLDQTLDRASGTKSRGDHVYTTLSLPLQEAAYQALGAYNGAIAVFEPSTGKILAMVSKPDFDPNTIDENWDRIVADENAESPLLNRASRGLYPPGSTFKICTALAFLRQKPDAGQSYEYQCGGSLFKGDSKISCYGGEVHGSVDLQKSFVESCNTSFANIGLSLDADAFADACEDLLFNRSLPVEKLDSAKSSFVLKDGASASEVMETSIGQGRTLVTPLHMLMLAGAAANGGILMKPQVIDFVESDEGGTVKTYPPIEYGRLMSGEEAAILQEYMKQTAAEGTASKLNGASYQAYGKTGSAEFGNEKGASHSWFVGYAKREDKETIAIAVIMEKAGNGSAYAVPAAKRVFDTYFE